ncbi:MULTISPECIES: hypothetical protein [unclassified Corynebacterium]|uniref:hypothetical protein n=1 Tax=unclassified Corynebacterium TaxID=2624378 RepID=UPI0029CA330E|nr:MULTISPECIES: hypothetical protein [unclassified Corynebacterium]WPF65185.1 hypothetical protein OLX12_06200 [Corynebacterium sp. 22KM0430]WPF67681.1 hypothetical protein OLW90_06195 [Corynebacterium sp. 21KM1197]
MGIVELCVNTYMESGINIGLVLVFLASLSFWVWGLWSLLAAPDFGITYFHVRKDLFSVHTFNRYELVPGTATLNKNEDALFIKSFTLSGEWEMEKSRILFFKERDVVSKIITQHINANMCGTFDSEEVVRLVESGNLLSPN